MVSKDKEYIPNAAKLKQEISYKEYIQWKSAYEKVYDKTNIALAFCGAIMAFFYNTFDSARFKSFLFEFNDTSCAVIGYCALIVFGMIVIIVAVIKLLILLLGKEHLYFNSNDIPIIYSDTDTDERINGVEGVEVWIIDKLTEAINGFRESSGKKQKSLNCAIILMGISFILFSLALLLK